VSVNREDDEDETELDETHAAQANEGERGRMRPNEIKSIFRLTDWAADPFVSRACKKRSSARPTW
jgi:hypothetical protein